MKTFHPPKSEQAVTEELVGLAAEHVRPNLDFRARVLATARKTEQRRTRLKTVASVCLLLFGTSILTAGMSVNAHARTSADLDRILLPKSVARANEHREAFAAAHVGGEWNAVEAVRQFRRTQSDALRTVFTGRRAAEQTQ